MDKIKVGIVGVGHLGSQHVRVFKSIPDAEVSGIYDINRERAREIAEKWRVRNYPDLD